MLEKMQLIYLMGRISNIDRAIDRYITKYEIQLEYGESEIKSEYIIGSALTENPYSAHVEKAETVINNISHHKEPWIELPPDKAIEIINEAYDFLLRRKDYYCELEERLAFLSKCASGLEPFKDWGIDIMSLKELRFISFRLGKMPVVNFKQFEIYVYEQEDIIFLESKRDKNFVYGSYFIPARLANKVDAQLSSLNFETLSAALDYDEQSTFQKAYKQIQDEIKAVQKEISFKHNETMYTYGINSGDVADAYNSLKKYQEYFDIRKYAAKTDNDYYIFVGWATEACASKLERDIEYDEKLIFMKEDIGGIEKSAVPSSLKNNSFIKPFEFFVKAYGLPGYDEIDPTPFVAVTYFIFFGMMFGDLGQGAVLFLSGNLLYKAKGLELGKILSFVGISSMFFGLMYGSFFGFEHLIPTIWLKPAESVNSILIITLICGMVLTFVSMLLNILNGVKQKDKAKLFFGQNGIAGVVFYSGIILTAAAFVNGAQRLAAILLLPFVVLPLLLIAFKRQISHYLETRRLIIEGGIALFILETIIETFEILLTYFTNTVSFVRIGAFALSHAGMMGVVLLLAQRDNGYNLAVLVIGNIIVILMEGLVVGIQALRIQFYELFSRYYEGSGREFVSTRSELKHSLRL